MTNYRSLNHSKWACQYHVVFIPKYRKKAIYGSLRRHLGQVLRELARQRESDVEEGHLLADHVHMMVSIPPKYSVAQVIGYIKGKSAIYIAREFAGRSRSFVGQHFWARGYFVSTLGWDERAIHAYIRAQEQEDRRQADWTRAARAKKPSRRRGPSATSWSAATDFHRAIKRRVKAKQGFREFHAARRTIQGYEAMHMIRKGQTRWVSGSDVRRQIQFINTLFEVAA